FGEVILAAPDLDVNLLAQRLPLIRKLARRITVYVTAADLALRLSEKVALSPRTGRPSTALFTLQNLDVVDVSPVEPDLLSLHHSYYQYNSRVLQDEYAILHFNAPVGSRFGTTQILGDNFLYWQLRPDAR